MTMLRNILVVCGAVTVMLLNCATQVPDDPEAVSSGGITLFTPAGDPAAGAVVKLFDVDDTSRTPAYETIANSDGAFSLDNVQDGKYNLFAYYDSFIVYQDSVSIYEGGTTIRDDTLKPGGTLVGYVGVQPHDDARKIILHIRGTEMFSNVDANGKFTLANNPTGTFIVEIVPYTMPDYMPTYVQISLNAGRHDTLDDTLRPIYTGIPVITGIRSSYDTLNGIVRLTWNPTGYKQFQSYEIFRDYDDSLTLSSSPHAACTDTVFYDTIFRDTQESGSFSFSDPDDYRFKYRVAIRTKLNELGKMYGFNEVIAASPLKVKTSISIFIYHKGKGFYTDSTSINDTLLYIVKAGNPTRGLRSLSWLTAAGSALRAVELDSVGKTVTDSIAYSWGWKDYGEKRLFCRIIDNAGTQWTNSALTNVIIDPPSAALSSPVSSYRPEDTIHLHLDTADWFGTVTKIEWDIGNTGDFSTGMTLDTIVAAPDDTISAYRSVVRLTDDDGSTALDTLSCSINYFGRERGQWQQLDGPAQIGAIITQGTDLFATDENGVYVSSNNGLTWSAINDGLPVSSSGGYKLAVSGDTLFTGFDLFNIFLSTDKGTTWMKVDSVYRDTIPEEHLACLAVFGIDLFVGTECYVGKKNCPLPFILHSSDNGSTWVRADSGLDSIEYGIRAIAKVGTYLVAGNHDVHFSADNGKTWGSKFSYDGFTSVKSFSVSGESVYVSTGSMGFCDRIMTDVGNHWTFPSGLPEVQYGSDWKGTWRIAISSGVIKGDYVFCATDSGVYCTPDVLINFKLFRNDNTIYNLVVNEEYLFAVTGDGLFWRRPLNDFFYIKEK